MKYDSSKGGFVLVFSLVLLAISTIVLGSLYTLVSMTVRQSAIYEGRNACRLAAQSAIEYVKPAIEKRFQDSIGGTQVKIGPRSSTAYSWFNLPNGGMTLGNSRASYTLPSTNIVINGCEVKLQFGPCRQVDNSSSAIVSLIARARRPNVNGTVSSSVIEELFRFGTGRSKVFDYAYFVNNYGWFQGSGGTANGDVRANGNMYLDTSCKINGRVYAAYNEELGVRGTVQNYGKMDSRSAYWSSSKTSTQSRPTSPPSNNGVAWAGGYEAPVSTATTADLKNRIVDNSSDAKYNSDDRERGIVMPWIGDLDQYVEYAREERGTLSGGIRYSMNVDGTVVQKPNDTINAHFDGAGPSGDASLSDKGSIVLEGTASNPIRINGPVVIDSDVVIKGYVTGQGTIYSGRNIHVVGNIQYKNPPSWSHPDSNPEATAKVNATKDLIGFAAKGNIVLGDASNSSIFTSSIKSYLSTQPYVQQYVCDDSDRNIGYPRSIEYGYTRNESKFCGDYTQVDGGSLVTTTTKKETQTTTTPVYNSKTRKWENKTTTTEITKNVFSDSHTRHYYDSVVHNSLIKSLYSANGSNFLITKIDGVLYNNHGTFGKIGACTINGSLVCRNEGILYSSYLNINHDIRLREDSAEGIDNKVGMPLGAAAPGVISWHELPESVTFATFLSSESGN